MVEGPRIYNLFPRLVGPLNRWKEHITRAKMLGFNWIYVNPVNYPGFSASLYATKDHFKLNPAFAPEHTPEEQKTDMTPFQEFVGECHAAQLGLMVDLVINHTSIDCDLVRTHPSWYVHKWAAMSKDEDRAVHFFEGNEDPRETGQVGKWSSTAYTIQRRVANPYAIDPANARNVTVWGDLAEIDNENSSDWENLWAFWDSCVDFYLQMGVEGFRCDAAYKVPATLWRRLIEHARKSHTRALFVAETLGCTLPQIQALAGAGFDYIFSSSKYWDFTAGWAPEQYNSFRTFAPSISFPESHDTQRLAAETGGLKDLQVFRYLFAAFFSSGVLMPIGYEFGFRTKLDVVLTSPADWETPLFDLSPEIAAINAFKQSVKCLNEDGPMVHVGYGDLNILVLRKESLDGYQQLLLVYNKDWSAPHHVYLGDLDYFLTLRTRKKEIKTDGSRKTIAGNSWDRELRPNEYALFLQEK